MQAVKRTADGKFAKGNPGGPGRPPRKQEIAYLKALHEAVSLADWKELCVSALEQAKAGDYRAREWLSRYLVGSAGGVIDLLSTEFEKERMVEDLSFLNVKI